MRPVQFGMVHIFAAQSEKNARFTDLKFDPTKNLSDATKLLEEMTGDETIAERRAVRNQDGDWIIFTNKGHKTYDWIKAKKATVSTHTVNSFVDELRSMDECEFAIYLD